MASESDTHASRGAPMQRHDGCLSIAQVRALRALNCGGMLTPQQIQAAAGLTKWMTRRTIADLTRRKLIFAGARPGRYEITRLGQNALAATHVHVSAGSDD